MDISNYTSCSTNHIIVNSDYNSTTQNLEGSQLEVASVEYPNGELSGTINAVCPPKESDAVAVVNWKTWVTLATVILMLLGLILNLYASFFIVLAALVFLLLCQIITLKEAVQGMLRSFVKQQRICK